MARRTLHITLALAASGILLLSACGGSDDESPDKIEGADSGDKSPSAASADSDAKRPEITIPKGFQAEFVGWTDSDPKKQVVLNDGKERLRAAYAAVMEGEPDAEYFAFYNSGGGLSTGKDWVASFQGKTLVGSVTVSDPQIRLSAARAATLFYCVDESKGFSKDLQTGEREGTPEGEDPRVAYRTALTKSDDGVWVTRSVETEAGGCS